MLLAFKLLLSLWQLYFYRGKNNNGWVFKVSLVNERYTGSLPNPVFLSQYLHLLKMCQQWGSTHLVGYLVWKKGRGCANTGCGWVPEGPARCRGEGDRGAKLRPVIPAALHWTHCCPGISFIMARTGNRDQLTHVGPNSQSGLKSRISDLGSHQLLEAPLMGARLRAAFALLCLFF